MTTNKEANSCNNQSTCLSIAANRQKQLTAFVLPSLISDMLQGWAIEEQCWPPQIPGYLRIMRVRSQGEGAYCSIVRVCSRWCFLQTHSGRVGGSGSSSSSGGGSVFVVVLVASWLLFVLVVLAVDAGIGLFVLLCCCCCLPLFVLLLLLPLLSLVWS
jgi:hypothetical protein